MAAVLLFWDTNMAAETSCEKKKSSKLNQTLPKTLKNYLLQHMQTPEKKAQNTTLAARKTGDWTFLRKLKDILGV